MFIVKGTMTLSIMFILIAVFSVASSGEKDKESTTKSKDAPVYKPPTRGAPKTRVGGGTRGEADSTILTVLAPEHTGLTTTAQPTLYWYIAEPSNTRTELTVIDDTSIEPLLEINIDTPLEAGVQQLRLTDHNIHLKPGIEYQWSVAMINEPDQRSNDVVSSGTIEYIEPSADIRARLGQVAQEDTASIYANQGFWYDAIESLSELIAARPKHPHLRQQRAALLEQVTLPEVADFDRGQYQLLRTQSLH